MTAATALLWLWQAEQNLQKMQDLIRSLQEGPM